MRGLQDAILKRSTASVAEIEGFAPSPVLWAAAPFASAAVVIAMVVAVIIPAVAPDGYTGDIELIVGVNNDGTVAGVRALAHRETPGLGDKVDIKKSDWIRGFEGRSLDNPKLEGWAVKRDKGEFDQFTGATITPRAVVAATLRVLQFAQANRTSLFGEPDGDDS